MASVSARYKQRLLPPVLQEGGRSALFRDWVLPRGIEGGISATIPAMPIEQIVKQLQAERDRLDVAIKALTMVVGSNTPQPKRKHTMSASARKKISLAQKARWARRTLGSQAATARPKRTMSAAARRKIAAAQRVRWAKVKAKQQKKAG